MPLHLLGKKSWNVYNPRNIARVKADEEAAAAREAEEDRRLQGHDAAKRAALLRGLPPPPSPEPLPPVQAYRSKDAPARDHKRKRLAGEDDTDRDLRLARDVTGPKDDDKIAIMKLRNPKLDAPLTDHTGHINLFPMDPKEMRKLEQNDEAEREKRKKERQRDDQLTMRLSNAAGKDGLGGNPWYTTTSARPEKVQAKEVDFIRPSQTDAWGNPDPGREQRERARLAAADPLLLIRRGEEAADAYYAEKRERQKGEERRRHHEERELRREERHRRHRRVDRHRSRRHDRSRSPRRTRNHEESSRRYRD